MHRARTGVARLLLAALLLASGPMVSTAQAPQKAPMESDAGDNVPRENLSFVVGDILEILPVIEAENPSYAWVLTEGETFLQAGRARFFRVRFIRPGSYFLHAEIGGDNGDRARRLFVMEVKPRNGQEETTSDDETELVRGTPAIDAQDRISLTGDRQITTLTPVSVERRPLFLDLDLTNDSDGNGNAADDRDTSDSFFETSATPLQLWFPNLRGPRAISVRMGDEGALRQNITIYPGTVPVGPTLGQTGPLRIVTTPAGESTFRFTVAFEDGTPQVPLLLRWDFGDGQESLLSEPTHVFETPDKVTVTVHVRNLLTGQEIGTATTQVTPQGDDASSASAGSQASVNTKPDVTAGGASWLWMILVLLLIFVLSAGFGVLVIWLLKKLRRGRTVSESLASMEKTIVTKGEDKAPPPLTFTAPIAPKKDVAPTPSLAPTPKAPEPPKTPAAPTPAPAPGWLQKGLETAPKATTPVTSAPAPVPAPTPVTPPKPAPAPAPKPVTPPSAPAKPDLNSKPGGSADLPPWLAATPGPKPVETFGSTPPAPKPAPTPAPAPKKEEAPKPVTPATPAPAPMPTPVAVPAPKAPEPALPVGGPPKAPVAPTPVPPPAPVVQTPPPAPTPAPAKTETPTTPPPSPKMMDIPLMTKADAQPMPTPAEDTTPIAIIQVDSLKTDESAPPKAP